MKKNFSFKQKTQVTQFVIRAEDIVQTISNVSKKTQHKHLFILT